MKKYILLWLTIGLLWQPSFSIAQTINEIIFKGNTKTKTSFLRKISRIAIGEVTDSTALAKNRDLLTRLPSIANAAYRLESNNNNEHTLVYTIQENHTLIPYGNIYATHNESVALQLGATEFNLFGNNISLGGYYQHDVFNSYELQFRAPFLFGKNYGIGLGHKNRTTQEPVYFNDYNAQYRYHIRTFEVMGLIQLNPEHRLEVGVNIFKEDYAYLFGAPEDAFLPELTVDKKLFRSFHEFNNLSYNYQYISGFKNQINLQYVTNDKAGVKDFVIGWNDFFYFKRIGLRGNWANRLRVGFSSNDKTPFAPFALDNNINIRGVGLDVDRGTGVISLNTEYRYTLLDKTNWIVQGNGFIDVGTWRSAGATTDSMFESDAIKLYPGIGLRLMHKKIFNAILRIDYGHGIGTNANRGIVFGIGQYF